MPDLMFTTPILFLIFNRPEQTQHVFDAIRREKPKQLFIAADGPRRQRPDDIALIERCKKIVSQVDWDCEVKQLFRTDNMGCGAAPANAITWFFDQVAEGIILEDDCVPNESFFIYCQTLLEKYRHNNSIMAICGTSYQPQPLDDNTYYFSKYVHVWGWASWRRAWSRYNFKLSGEGENVRKAVINNTFSNPRERKMWVHNMQLIVNGLDAWDYQLMYWLWKNNGLAIIPWKNMVSNIGFGELATHTFNSSSAQANIPTHQIISLKHPQKIQLNKKADRYERFHILISPTFIHFKNRVNAAKKRLLRILKLQNN